MNVNLANSDSVRTNLNVLCVEDSLFDRNYLVRLIQSEWSPLRLDAEASAAAALKLCQEVQYDVILTDFYMPPGENGGQFALKVRDAACRSHKAVIALFSSENLILDGLRKEDEQREKLGKEKIFNGGIYSKPYSSEALKKVFEACAPQPPAESKQPLK